MRECVLFPAITSLSLPPAVRANSLTALDRDLRVQDAESEELLGDGVAETRLESVVAAAAGLDGCRGTASTRRSGPSWMTWNSPT